MGGLRHDKLDASSSVARSGSEDDTAGVAGPPSLQAARQPLAAGAVVGRYAVLEELGSGGMGRVLRAYDPRLQREVAIKELRAHLQDEESTQRLVAEARAMAKLSHPNVVAIYDVEALGDDRHVLVMEYIAGQTLGAWIRSASHDWEAIVRHFVAAGRGLAAAHAAGVLHRDFKPANVLVAGAEIVKVTDFGLAKFDDRHASSELEGSEALSGAGASAEVEALTGTGTVMGTPKYMAPEQHQGGVLTPATDQYSFCVALWQALCGEAPFSGTSLAQLEARKLQGPPPWTKPDVPRAISEALRRGLSVDAEHRWPSMAALLAVLAPRDRRRARTVALAGLAVVGIAGANVWSWSATPPAPCLGAAEQVASLWDHPRRAEVRAAVMATALPYAEQTWSAADTRLDDYLTQWSAMHRDACEATVVRGEQSTALMDLRMRCLVRAKVVVKAVTEVLASADTDVVRNATAVLGDLQPLSRCADLDALVAAVQPPRVDEVEAVDALRALLAQAEAERHAGRHPAAESPMNAAKMAVAGLEYPPVHAEVALASGLLLSDLGRYADAEAALHEALQWGAKSRQSEVMQAATSQLVYVVGHQQARYDEATEYARFAVGLAEGDPAREATAHNHVASALLTRGDHRQAEAEIRIALAKRDALPEPDPLGVARLRNSLGIVLLAMGSYPEAESEFRLALSEQEAILGPGHPDVASACNNLANALYSARRYADAEVEYRRAHAIWEGAFGPGHPRVAFARHNIALVLNDQGKHSEAESEYRQALELGEAALGPTHPALPTFLYNLGNNLMAQGRNDAAELEFGRAVSVGEAALGEEHPMLAIARTSLADMLLLRGADGEALSHVQRAWTRNERDDVAAEQRAWTAYVLARAVWGTAVDAQARSRARALAQQAMAGYGERGDVFADKIAMVQDWLRTLPPP